MHVLFLTHWFPNPERPTYGIFILEHARAAAIANTVSLLHIKGINQALKTPFHVKTSDTLPGIMVHEIEYRPGRFPKLGWIAQHRAIGAYVKELSKSIGKIDIIHANTAVTAPLAFYLKQQEKVPAVLSEHSSAWPRNKYPLHKRLWYRYFLNKLDLLMPVSTDLQGHLEKKGVRNRFFPLPNAVDTDIFYERKPPTRSSPESKILATIVARLDQNKGVHLLLESLNLASKTGKQISLNIIGDGPDRQRLEEKCAALNLSEKVTFLGHLPKAQIAQVLRQSDLFVLSSFWENQPAALLEALCTGLPAIVPAVGGIPEIIEAPGAPRLGFLFKPGDYQGLANCLVEFDSQKDKFIPSQIASYAQAKFSLHSIGHQLDKIYLHEIERLKYHQAR